MTLVFKRDDRKISINGQIVMLPAPIWTVYEFERRVFVTMDPYSSSTNVLCFSEAGELLWRIAENGYFTAPGDVWYEGVDRDGIHRDGPLIAYCRGRPFYLDIENGKVTFIPGNFEK